MPSLLSNLGLLSTSRGADTENMVKLVRISRELAQEYKRQPQIKGGNQIELLINSIQLWGLRRNITSEGGATVEGQLDKLREELEELAVACKDKDSLGIADGIGDMVVVLLMICELTGIQFIEALDQAWNDIKDRKGKMIDGVFVKEIE